MSLRTTIPLLATGIALIAAAHPAHAQGLVADNVRTLNPPDSAEVPCSTPPVFSNGRLQDTSNGRIRIPALRFTARSANAMSALVNATLEFAERDPTVGRAFADLAVTGRRAYQDFLNRQPRMTVNEVMRRARATSRGRTMSNWQLLSGAQQALDRAYRVAHWLRFGGATTRGFRAALGFITVSGEDDAPWRPVNNSATADTQFTLPVRVGSHVVTTRFIMAGRRAPDPVRYRPLRLAPTPTIPILPRDAKVLIYLHGMDSRLEEAGDVIAAIRRNHARENLVVIAMDLPNSGYATQLDHTQIAPLRNVGWPNNVLGFDTYGRQNVAVLDFLEDFVVRFVDTLDRQTGAKDKVLAIMGGSLGGNLSFRLGRANLPWIRNVIPWSPAAVWPSFDENVVTSMAIKDPWDKAGGNADYLPETAAQRQKFFNEAFGDIPVVGPQDSTWWSDSWSCKTQMRRVARTERFEIYSQNFRKWHWRLAAEQLLFTQRNPPGSRPPRYLSNNTPMLLMAGTDDNFFGAWIYDNTRDIAWNMVKTPGRARMLTRTGHSIHNERPAFLARQIVSFLRDSERHRLFRDNARFRSVDISGVTLSDDIRRDGGSRGWVGVRLRSGRTIWSEITDQANRGRNARFRTTVNLGGLFRARDIAALLVRHRSGSCAFCSDDHWVLRAELSRSGTTLAYTGEFRIGDATRSFALP